jgi:transcriptional regulator with XRE-family HTH domain
MELPIKTPQELGMLVRATRKLQKIRMDDVAGSAGVGPVFVRDVERGKSTVQLGRVMKLLAELGIELRADVPEDVIPAFEQLKKVGVKPLKPRRFTKQGSPSAGATTSKSAKPKALRTGGRGGQRSDS